MTTKFRGMTKTLDSPKMAVAFMSDVLASIHQLWDRMPHEEVEVTVEITMKPSSNDTTGESRD